MPSKISVRNFGHCIVSWKIKNYFLATCNPGREIKSNPFHVHSWQDTRWQIVLRVEFQNTDCVVLLRRLSDEADELIKVQWSITIFDGNGDENFIKDNLCCFKQNSQCATVVFSPSQRYRVLDSHLDGIPIEIQMIVFMNAGVEIPNHSEIDVLSLVDNLNSARIKQLYTDLTIYLNVEDIGVHRAMLIRNKTLKQAEEAGKTRMYYIRDSDTHAFNSLVRYLYTSDLSHIFESPSVSTYRLIVDLNITELLDAYPQEKIFIETIIKANEFEYQWTIPDFTYNDNLPNSNIYEASGRNSNGIDWQLRIFPKEVAEDAEARMKYFYIEASIVNNARPQDVVICIKARNNEDQTIVVKRTYGKIERYMKLETKLMRIDNPSMAKSFYTLDISFSVRIGTGMVNSILTETRPPVDFRLTNTDAFGILQGHLKSLLEKSSYSDITLLVEDREFKCHKFLLAARSSVFFNILEKTTDASLAFRNINRNVFGVFLHYLYTGALPDVGPEAASDLSAIFIMHLYQLSLNFAVERLTCLCLNRLINQLTQENSCCMLLFADERRCLPELKSKALNLLSLHPDIVIHSQCGRRLEAKNPQLIRDVAAVLRTNSYRTEFDLDDELFVPDLLKLDDMIM